MLQLCIVTADLAADSFRKGAGLPVLWCWRRPRQHHRAMGWPALEQGTPDRRSDRDAKGDAKSAIKSVNNSAIISNATHNISLERDRKIQNKLVGNSALARDQLC